MHLIVDACSTQLLLRLTDSSDLGIGIDDTRDSAVAHHILRTGDVVYSDLPFASSGVSEHRRTIDITDSIDTRHRGLEVLIDDDSPTLELDTDRLQSQTISHSTTADADQQLVEGDLQRLALMLSDDLTLTHGSDLRGEVELHLALLEGLLQLPRELFVHRSEDLGQHLDDRDLHAERREEGHELHTDDPATEDDEALWEFLDLKCLLSCPEGHVAQPIDGWDEGT